MIRLKRSEGNELNTLLSVSNQTLAAFGQPPLYVNGGDPLQGEVGKKKDKAKSNQNRVSHNISCEDFTNSFHISLAWSLVEPPLDEHQRVSRVDLDLLKPLEISFTSVKAKIGNVVHNLKF